MKDIEQINFIANDFFGSNDDPEQVPANMDSFHKLLALDKNSIGVQTTDDGKIMGWCASFPTTIELMNKFMNNQINERQMFHMCSPGDHGALYVMSVFVLPEYRGQVNPKSLVGRTITPMRNADTQIFYDGFSEEGKRLGSLMSQQTKNAKMK